MPREIRPNLLIIGAMKASTTLLYQMLRRHPEVWLADVKEPHHFASDDYAEPGRWERYQRLFANVPAGKRYAGEASTDYTKMPHVGCPPARIRKKLGQPKLIYILRDPVGRTVSHFRHVYARGVYPAGLRLSEAIKRDPIIVDASRYGMQLGAYEDEFGAGSVHLVIAEQLHREPQAVMRDVESYLGVAAHDGWGEETGKANEFDRLRRVIAWSNVLRRVPGLRRTARLVPTRVKQLLYRVAPKMPRPPKVSQEDEAAVHERIADDLAELRERLGDRIAIWPSVRRLRESRVVVSLPLAPPREKVPN